MTVTPTRNVQVASVANIERRFGIQSLAADDRKVRPELRRLGTTGFGSFSPAVFCHLPSSYPVNRFVLSAHKNFVRFHSNTDTLSEVSIT